MPHKDHILFCILNWGLGHATRSIPIINLLIKKGFKVSIASDGRALSLLKAEFPALITHELPGYDISYSKSGTWLPIAFQLLGLPKKIKKESKAIKTLVEELSIDIIISDNRYGCFIAEKKNIFISHQINIKPPINFPGLESILFRIHKSYIEKYNELWIPDVDQDPNLSGDLGHKRKIKSIHTHYIGCLSRFKKGRTKLKYDVAIIISGPEPQRSIFTDLLKEQIKYLLRP